ncbi:hypothetical protein ACQ26G_001930 [Yersinia enterocolitica]|nr:hypothetical protein [Yersinia enterocolitica]
MKQAFFEVLLHAENALIDSEKAKAVLDMWLNSIPYGDEYKDEACRVDAVMGYRQTDRKIDTGKTLKRWSVTTFRWFSAMFHSRK